MSRILVLLSGYPCARSPWGNSQDHGTPDTSSFDAFYAGAKYLKKLLTGYSVDYICTTWDDVGEEHIRDTYEPLIYKSFSQEKFRAEISESLDSYENERMNRRTEYYRTQGQENNLVSSSIRVASQLQSRSDIAELALTFIEKTAVTYDVILLTRYDISTRGGFLVRHPTFLDRDDQLFLATSGSDPKFILPCFAQLNCGFPDMWFYMNLAGLKYYSSIADRYVSDITSINSEYFRLMTEGWPFSREFPLHSIYDFRQYSNEIFKKNRRFPLMKYPDWEVSNLHAYHKYYLRLKDDTNCEDSVRFKSRFDVFRSFFANTNWNSEKGQLFVELLSHLKFLFKIMLSRIALR